MNLAEHAKTYVGESYAAGDRSILVAEFIAWLAADGVDCAASQEVFAALVAASKAYEPCPFCLGEGEVQDRGRWIDCRECDGYEHEVLPVRWGNVIADKAGIAALAPVRFVCSRCSACASFAADLPQVAQARLKASGWLFDGAVATCDWCATAPKAAAS